MFTYVNLLLIGICNSACLHAEDLIKQNEGEVNFKPGSSRTVCWGSNADDLMLYLGKDYDEYAVKGWTLSEEECNTLFAKKIGAAIEASYELYGAGGPSCPCDRAAAIDVIYDMSPDIALVAPQMKDYHGFLNVDEY